VPSTIRGGDLLRRAELLEERELIRFGGVSFHPALQGVHQGGEELRFDVRPLFPGQAASDFMYIAFK
jgi:hypothetical protein